MTYFYVSAIIGFFLIALSVIASLDRIAKNLGVVATCNIFWMHYHGNEAEIREAGRIIAEKVGERKVEDVGLPS